MRTPSFASSSPSASFVSTVLDGVSGDAGVWKTTRALSEIVSVHDGHQADGIERRQREGDQGQRQFRRLASRRRQTTDARASDARPWSGNFLRIESAVLTACGTRSSQGSVHSKTREGGRRTFLNCLVSYWDCKKEGGARAQSARAGRRLHAEPQRREGRRTRSVRKRASSLAGSWRGSRMGAIAGDAKRARSGGGDG